MFLLVSSNLGGAMIQTLMLPEALAYPPYSFQLSEILSKVKLKFLKSFAT